MPVPAALPPLCREAAAEDFEEHVLPLLARYPARLRHPGFITLENFQVAAAYVASRAFGVDEWHGGWCWCRPAWLLWFFRCTMLGCW